MGLVKISELPDASAQTGTELFPFVQNGNTKKGSGGTQSGEYSVKTYGAVGNGIANDTAAFIAAREAAPVGSTIVVPDGIYLVEETALFLYKSNVTYSGNGMFRSIIKAHPSFTLSAISQCIFGVSGVVFEDIGFEGNGVSLLGISFQSGNATRCRVSRCAFSGFGGQAIFIEASRYMEVENCLFTDRGAPFSTGVLVAESSREISIHNNTFLWMKNGILVNGISEHITVSDNYFDQGWWLLKHKAVNSGATVSYTSTVLTDTVATFTSLSIAVDDVIRIMPVKRTGTSTVISPTSLTDPSANFVTAGVKRGDIVRTGSAFGVVASVESATKLRMEPWWDDTTRALIYPSTGTYTVYGVYVGRVTAVTATTITVQYFHDLLGNAVTPTAQTRYEIMVTKGVYGGLNTEAGCRYSTFTRNTFRRSWADQLSVFGGDNVLSFNVIEDGQDEGITSGGPRNTIVGNHIARQGTSCIYVAGESTVTGNSLVDAQTQNNFDPTGTGVLCVSGNKNTVTTNVIYKDASAVVYGITILGDNNRVAHNSIIGAFTHGIKNVAGSTNSHIYSNGGTLSDSGTLTDLGVGLLSTGTASNPSLAFAADPNTGIYQADVGRLDFVVDGSIIMSLNGPNINFEATFYPESSATYDLGKDNKRFRHGFFSGIVVAPEGIRMKSPDGTEYSVRPANGGGSLTITPA